MAVMVLALPINSLQAPGRILLNRNLRYDSLLAVDSVALLAYHGFAITAVAAGAGVWGLAIGTVLRSIVSTVGVGLLSSAHIVRPSLRSISRLGSVMRFGIRFQATYLVAVVRDQGVNATTAIVAGVPTLGLWSLARRTLDLPLVLFDSVWRVSFPALSRMLGHGDDPTEAAERTIRLTAIAAAVLLSTFAAASPELIPSIFGEQWREAAEVVPFACAALLISYPINIGLVSYLWASGHAGPPLRAVVLGAFAWLGTSAILLPSLGVAAIGVGWMVAACVEVLALTRIARDLSRIRALRQIGLPLTVGAVAAVAGLFVTAQGGSLSSAIAGAGTALAVSVAGLALASWTDFRATVDVGTGAVRDALARR